MLSETTFIGKTSLKQRRTQQRPHTKRRKHQGRDGVDPTHGDARAEFVACKNRRHIGHHHAQRRAHDDRHRVVELGGQSHSRDLCFVAHFGQEKRHHSGTEYAQAMRDVGFVVFNLIRDQGPCCHRQETQAQDPAQDIGTHLLSDPHTHGTGEAVVEYGGQKNPRNDWQGTLKTRSQQEREQLRFVTDFGQGDDANGEKKRFQNTPDFVEGQLSANANIAASSITVNVTQVAA